MTLGLRVPGGWGAWLSIEGVSETDVADSGGTAATSPRRDQLTTNAANSWPSHPSRSASCSASDQRLAQELRDSSAGPSAAPRSVSR